MQLESRRAVPQASLPPIIQSLSQDILKIPQLDGREVKNHCRLRDHDHFSIFLFFDTKLGSCQPICGIIIANKSFSSAKAALVCSFRASGKNRRHLGCRNVMCSRRCTVQNKGMTLSLSFKPVSQCLLFFQDELEAQSFLFIINRIAKYSSGRFPSSSNCLKSYKCA